MAVGLSALVLAVAFVPGSSGLARTVSVDHVADVAVAGATGPTWNNGVTVLSFSQPFPTFTVTSLSDRRVASMTAPSAIAELSPNGNVSFIAHLQARNATWMFSSAAGAGGTTIWANASVPVAGSHGGWKIDEANFERPTVEAKAKVSLAFYLNASTSPDPTGIRFAVNVTNWPWNNASDSLGLEISSTAVPSTMLSLGVATNQLLEVRAGTNLTVATLSWDTVASVVYSGGGLNTSAVGTDQDVALNGSNSTIRLSFGSVPGGYSELEYDPIVQLSPSAFHVLPGPPTILKSLLPPAWHLDQVSLEAVGAGAIVAVLLAAVAWRSRSSGSPSE